MTVQIYLSSKDFTYLAKKEKYCEILKVSNFLLKWITLKNWFYLKFLVQRHLLTEGEKLSQRKTHQNNIWLIHTIVSPVSVRWTLNKLTSCTNRSVVVVEVSVGIIDEVIIGWHLSSRKLYKKIEPMFLRNVFTLFKPNF